MTTGSPAASRTCRRPMWNVSSAVSVRPKKAGTPGSAARWRSRSARAAPRRSEAHASTPASTTADAALRISVRQSAARARWARSAVRTGSGVVAVSGAAAEGDTVAGGYAVRLSRSGDFRYRKSLAGFHDVDVDRAELGGGLQQDRFRRLTDVQVRLAAERGQGGQPTIGEHLVDQPAVATGEQSGHRAGVREQHAHRGLHRVVDDGVGLVA